MLHVVRTWHCERILRSWLKGLSDTAFIFLFRVSHIKMSEMHFLPVFELMSDSLMAIQVEPHQCPSHQSILLTQGPIHEIFEKILRIGGIEKLTFFE